VMKEKKYLEDEIHTEGKVGKKISEKCLEI
jgi:hypothetical protein